MGFLPGLLPTGVLLQVSRLVMGRLDGMIRLVTSDAFVAVLEARSGVI